MDEVAEIENVVCVHATTEAIKVEINGKEEWVPRSQIFDDSEVQDVGDSGTLSVAEWFAVDKGWV
jgi:hypothetical protein